MAGHTVMKLYTTAKTLFGYDVSGNPVMSDYRDIPQKHFYKNS